MNETRILSDYLSNLQYDDLPKEAVVQVKKALLDWLGLAVSGSPERAPSILRKVLLPSDGGSDSTVFAKNCFGKFGFRKSALNAAFVNGAASHAQDFDDLHNPSIIHLACVVIPPAVALGEKYHVSGKELITAIAAGYELGGRVGEAVQPDSYYFWHTTGTVGTLAAAAASARILRLDGLHYLHALGSAGTQAAGLWDFVKQGAMSKPLHIGKACYGGMLSALLAREGFTGSATILEGEKGFCRAMMKEPVWNKLTESLGKDFIIIHNSIKPYPCCKHSHAAIYGIRRLMDKYVIRFEDIRKIILDVNDITDSLINNPSPATPYGCKFSIQYCVASMAVRGQVGLGDFREETIHDERVRRMMEKIEVVRNPEITENYRLHPDQLASRVRVVTKDGRCYTTFVPYPAGDPENPLSLEDISRKGHGMTDSLIGEKTYGKLEKLVRHLEDVDDWDETLGAVF